jgi:hypothetical protein
MGPIKPGVSALQRRRQKKIFRLHTKLLGYLYDILDPFSPTLLDDGVNGLRLRRTPVPDYNSVTMRSMIQSYGF